MLPQFATGDAYGAGFEFAPREFVEQHNLAQGMVQNPVFPDLTPGKYTDDTQMTIAIMKYMLATRFDKKVSAAGLFDRFLKTYKDDRRNGYSSGFKSILDRSKNWADLTLHISPTSNKSGGLMRSIPCGYFQNLEDCKNFAAWQCSLTHGTHEAIQVSVFMAILVWYLRRGYPVLDAIANAAVQSGHGVRNSCPETVRNLASDVLQAVVYVLRNSKSVLEATHLSVSITGDVDTVAALSAGLMSIIYPKDNTSQLLTGQMSETKRHMDVLYNLDNEFAAAFKVPKNEWYFDEMCG